MEIEKERFEHWLFSQPDDRMIHAGCNECFLGTFLIETHGLSPIMTWSKWFRNVSEYENTFGREIPQ